MSESDKPETRPPAYPPPPGYPPQGGYSPQAGYPYGAYPGNYPAPPPLPYAGGYTPPPLAPKNGLGITALVLAIVALVGSFTIIGGIVLGLAAIITGFIGRGRAKRGEATNGGMAVAGVALGAFAIVVSLVFIPIWIGVFREAGFGNYVDCMNAAGTDTAAQQRCEQVFKERIEDKLSVSATPTP